MPAELTCASGLRIKPKQEQTAQTLTAKVSTVGDAIGDRTYMAQTKTAPPPASTSKRTPRTLAGVLPPAADTGRAQALLLYESALRLMQAGKYDDARSAF